MKHHYIITILCRIGISKIIREERDEPVSIDYLEDFHTKGDLTAIVTNYYTTQEFEV